MTRKEIRDLAFENTIEYMRLLETKPNGRDLMLIARAIGNYETEIEKLESKGASTCVK